MLGMKFSLDMPRESREAFDSLFPKIEGWGYVYGLKSARGRKVVYVGKTSGAPYKRLAYHVSWWAAEQMRRWVRSVGGRSGVTLVALMMAPLEAIEDAEEDCIRWYRARGEAKLNLRMPCKPGRNRKKKKPTVNY